MHTNSRSAAAGGASGCTKGGRARRDELEEARLLEAGVSAGRVEGAGEKLTPDRVVPTTIVSDWCGRAVGAINLLKV